MGELLYCSINCISEASYLVNKNLNSLSCGIMVLSPETSSFRHLIRESHGHTIAIHYRFSVQDLDRYYHGERVATKGELAKVCLQESEALCMFTGLNFLECSLGFDDYVSNISIFIYTTILIHFKCFKLKCRCIQMLQTSLQYEETRVFRSLEWE
jgi:hypothetical protein